MDMILDMQLNLSKISQVPWVLTKRQAVINLDLDTFQNS